MQGLAQVRLATTGAMECLSDAGNAGSSDPELYADLDGLGDGWEDEEDIFGAGEEESVCAGLQELPHLLAPAMCMFRPWAERTPPPGI